MKHALFLALALCIVSFTVQAGPAWCDEDNSGQCMEDCLKSAVESSDPDVLEKAIQACEPQCLASQNPLEGVGANGMSKGRCITNCASELRNCLKTVQNPKICNVQHVSCKRKCNF
ncbi:MAG: hypothetical protein PWQ57_2847 [Desulfovibrionales bacterium]|nr:hypothetical protein [Desulfovibrionales bacterium]